MSVIFIRGLHCAIIDVFSGTGGTRFIGNFRRIMM